MHQQNYTLDFIWYCKKSRMPCHSTLIDIVQKLAYSMDLTLDG